MHSGASVNVVTKSGTNLLHGDLFEFVRNHRFNATNPFNAINPATGERQGDGLSRNQYGGTLGGPIATDRLFFFGAYPGNADFAKRPLISSPSFRRPRCSRATSRSMPPPSATRPAPMNLRAPFVNNRINPALVQSRSAESRRSAAHDDRPVRALHLQPQPSAGRSAVHRQGRPATQPEPLDVRPLHVHCC